MFDFFDNIPVSLMRELEDTAEGICLKGQPLKTRIIPVYLAEDDPRREPVERPEDYVPSGLEMCSRKYLALPIFRLYRCAETEGKWHFTSNEHVVSIDTRNISIEVIDPYEEELCVKHYILTSRKDAEDPDAQEFEYQVSGGEVTITGVHHYCERLHIPAVLDGKPVTGVTLPVQQELFYLREVVMPESIRTIDFCWEYPDLDVIQIPENAVLAGAPDGVNLTPWFRHQPEGAVYFQNYYCGTKGMPDARELILRDGTIGSIRSVDSDRRWDAITFPPSFRHMGFTSFLRSADCRLIVPECCEEVKAHFARRCIPKPTPYRPAEYSPRPRNSMDSEQE